MRKIIAAAAVIMAAISGKAQEPEFLSGSQAMLRVDAKERYLLLPVEEKEPNASVRVLNGGTLLQSLNVRLAVDKVDYLVPLDIQRYGVENLILDITFKGDREAKPGIGAYSCWKEIRQSPSFDTANRERFRPVYHHTPEYGWMNDPNGMFYKDGVYHLYYQWNPYGSQWENMTWGHSVSKDLVNWEALPTALEPDALGTIFSGSCVVDLGNTSGYGKGAVVAFYTSAGANQVQSTAYSTDDGKTFRKSPSNPVITGDCPDFRDPKAFWNPEINRWNLILAAGQEVRIYSSPNLKDWILESRFGEGFGSHEGVWECPDLVQLPVRGTGERKWLLICNIGSGGPSGGSATQYFIGDFDGHRFSCGQKDTKWMDHGKDHYATVTFDNAPEGRRIALAWMSNWQYAGKVPTRQFRSADSVPRDLDVYEYEGDLFCGVTPSKELLIHRGKPVSQPTEACEIVVDMKADALITLSNPAGEKVVMKYDSKARTFSMDRTGSGETSFSEAFPATTSAPVHGNMRRLRIFVDRCSIEAFDAEGRMAMTNLVFPSEPYSNLTLKGCKAVIYPLGRE